MNDEEIRRGIIEMMRRDTGAPDFDEAWRAAEACHRRNRSRNRFTVGIAVTIAAVAIVVVLDLPQAGKPIVEMSDLLGSTSWQAPSDVLLPDHQTDIYQELPDLIEFGDAAMEAFL